MLSYSAKVSGIWLLMTLCFIFTGTKVFCSSETIHQVQLSVFDEITRKPIESAYITYLDSLGYQSSISGEFGIAYLNADRLQDSSLYLSIEMEGYAPVSRFVPLDTAYDLEKPSPITKQVGLLPLDVGSIEKSSIKPYRLSEGVIVHNGKGCTYLDPCLFPLQQFTVTHKALLNGPVFIDVPNHITSSKLREIPEVYLVEPSKLFSLNDISDQAKLEFDMNNQNFIIKVSKPGCYIVAKENPIPMSSKETATTKGGDECGRVEWNCAPWGLLYSNVCGGQGSSSAQCQFTHTFSAVYTITQSGTIGVEVEGALKAEIQTSVSLSLGITFGLALTSSHPFTLSQCNGLRIWNRTHAKTVETKVWYDNKEYCVHYVLSGCSFSEQHVTYPGSDCNNPCSKKVGDEKTGITIVPCTDNRDKDGNRYPDCTRVYIPNEAPSATPCP